LKRQEDPRRAVAQSPVASTSIAVSLIHAEPICASGWCLAFRAASRSHGCGGQVTPPRSVPTALRRRRPWHRHGTPTPVWRPLSDTAISNSCPSQHTITPWPHPNSHLLFTKQSSSTITTARAVIRHLQPAPSASIGPLNLIRDPPARSVIGIATSRVFRSHRRFLHSPPRSSTWRLV
jgi:hypothetical protein